MRHLIDLRRIDGKCKLSRKLDLISTSLSDVSSQWQALYLDWCTYYVLMKYVNRNYLTMSNNIIYLGIWLLYIPLKLCSKYLENILLMFTRDASIMWSNYIDDCKDKLISLKGYTLWISIKMSIVASFRSWQQFRKKDESANIFNSKEIWDIAIWNNNIL